VETARWGAFLGGASIHLIQPFKNQNIQTKIFLNMRIFEKKAIKLPQRRGFRPSNPIGLRRLGAPSPDSRIVTLSLLL